MSLILKGIDLPKKGFIKLEIHSDGLVWEEGRDWSKYENAAIQIPKGHGRIVDLEKLKEEFAMKNNICKECDSFKECDNKSYSKSEICEKIIWVPTILEAEE